MHQYTNLLSCHLTLMVFIHFLWTLDSLVYLSDLFLSNKDHVIILGLDWSVWCAASSHDQRKLGPALGFGYRRREPGDNVGSHSTSLNLDLIVSRRVSVFLELKIALH